VKEESYVSNVHILELPNLVLLNQLLRSLYLHGPRKGLKKKSYILLKEYCIFKIIICTDYSTDIHHMCGRIGDLLLDTTYWKALCRNCHEWAESHPEEAKEKGLSINRLIK
jgi:hypothetical protein